MKVLLLLLIPLGGYILNNLYPDEAKNLISFTKQILPYLLLLIVAIFIHWVKMQIKNASGKEMDEGKEYLGDAISKEVIKVKYTKENISYSKVLFLVGMIFFICVIAWSYFFPNDDISPLQYAMFLATFYILFLLCTNGISSLFLWVKMQIKNASGKEMDEGKEYLGDAISKEVIKVKYTKENISYSKVLFFIGMILLICAMVWSYLFPNSNIKNDRLLLFFLCTCGISLYYAFRIKKWEMRRKKLRIGNKEK
jgi:hypothetical protein